MKTITINSQKHGIHTVLVDDEDFELVSKYNWRIEKGRTTFYAIHSSGWYWYGGKTIKKGITIRMHQLILGINPLKDGKRSVKVDHIDHNGLNNQRHNIRICTNSQNGANRKLQRTNNTTGYKGVSYKIDKRRGRNVLKYCARIRVNDSLIHLGMFHDPKEAAIKYNEAALKYFGDFALLNQIPNG